jgi:RNA polymerase primary sigma factor
VPSFGVHERSPEADVALVRRARCGDLQAREDLCASCLGLVRAVATHYQGLGLALDDLVQEGSIGLLEAIARFDPARGVAFRAFAAWRIRRAILEALTEQSRLVRLPKGVVQARRAIARADARLAAALGHTPSDEELAAETGLPDAVVAVARRPASPPASLNGEASPLETMLEDTAAPDPEAVAVSHERSHLLATALARLDSRELEIVSRHFGLDGAAAPIPEVAQRLGLSDERTRALERHALYGLRKALESAGLPG